MDKSKQADSSEVAVVAPHEVFHAVRRTLGTKACKAVEEVSQQYQII